MVSTRHRTAAAGPDRGFALTRSVVSSSGRGRVARYGRPVDATRRFNEVVSTDEIRLDEGAFLIAAHAHPDLDVPAQMGRLDDLARGCPGATLDDLRAYLFEEQGFRGNTTDYQDPENSFVDSVLDRRLGIPITLSIVALEVGRRVGVPLGGVGMPGHFLVRHLGDPGLYLDAFGGGRVIGAPDCRSIFERLHGDGLSWRDEFLEVVEPRSILLRMLNNLRGAFASRGDLTGLSWVLELQLAFPDLGPDERLAIAAMLGQTGRIGRAASELESIVGDLPDDEAEKAERQARALRARLN